MSAFLGPIHFWVFNRVKIQNQLIERLISCAGGRDSSGKLRQELSERYGELESAPLEKIIDERNIHGWLQERVTMVEQKLAHVVTELLCEDANVLPDLQKICFQTGVESKSIEFHSATEAYRYLNDTLLDGMPCDRANDVISESDKEVVWRRNTCVHEQYWTAVNGNIAVYYTLREDFINGMLHDSGFVYEKIDEVTSRLRR